jgi:hypothetical protein
MGIAFPVVLSVAKDLIALVTQRQASCAQKRHEILRFAQDDRGFATGGKR